MNFPSGRPVAVVILTYGRVPDRTSIERVIHHVDWVALVDNGSPPEILAELRRLQSSHKEKCLLIENGRNLGIPRAYNAAIAQLHDLGAFWFFFLDHDASFDESLIREAGEAWNEASKSGLAVGVIVPLVSDSPSSFRTRLSFRSRYSVVRTAITSGIMVNYDVFSAVHGFDERVFLDGADFEFTTRVRRLGLVILRVNQVLIIQEFGNNPQIATSVRGILDFATQVRSLVRVGMGNANIYRTRLNAYSPPRQQSMAEGLRHIRSSLPEARFELRFVQVLIDGERALIALASKIAPQRSLPHGPR